MGCPPLCDNMDPAKDRFIIAKSGKEALALTGLALGAATLGAGIAVAAEALSPVTAATGVVAASKIPFEGFQRWGREAVGWGQNAAGAIRATAEMTSQKAGSLDPAKVQMAKQFYENAVASGKGGAAAPARVQLMEKILELQKLPK